MWSITRLGRSICRLNPKSKLWDQFHEVARFSICRPVLRGNWGEWVVRIFKAGEILKGLTASSPGLAGQRTTLGNQPRPFINSERVVSTSEIVILAPCLNPSRLTFRLGSRIQDNFTGHICIYV